MTKLRMAGTGLLIGMAAATLLVGPARAEVSKGSCWDLNSRQIKRGSFPPAAWVVCSLPHTIEVAAVRQQPKSIAKYGRTSPEAIAWRNQKCQNIVDRYSDATVYDRGFVMRWMSPNKKQWRKGDRRLVCGGAAMNARLTKFQSMDTAVADRETKQACYRLARRSGFAPTSCPGAPFRRELNLSLGWKHVATKDYPGIATVAARARKVVRAEYGNSVSYAYPSRTDWRRGLRFVSPMSPRQPNVRAYALGQLP